MKNIIKYFILIVVTIKVSYAGRGAFLVIQNSSTFPISISSSSSCVTNAEKIPSSLLAFQANKLYLEASNGFSSFCFIPGTSNGNIEIKVNQGILKFKYYISNTGSSISLKNQQGNTDIVANAYYKNRYDRLMTNSQDLVVINIKNKDLYKYTKWMELNKSKLLNKKLSETVITGSHDSFTYDLSSITLCDSDPNKSEAALIPKFGLKFAKAQSLNFAEQLASGIRYFDVRLCKQNGRVFTTHSLLSNRTFEEQTDVLRSFLDNNPYEIIILDFQAMFGFDSAAAAQFLKDIQEKYGNKIASYKDLKPSSRLEDFWKLNKNLIIIVPQQFVNLSENYNWIWPREEVIVSLWDSNIYNDFNNIMKYDMNNLSNRSLDKLFVSQMQFSPDTDFIINNPSSSLEDLAYFYVSDTNYYLNLFKNVYKWNLNIYIKDFVKSVDGVVIDQ